MKESTDLSRKNTIQTGMRDEICVYFIREIFSFNVISLKPNLNLKSS